MIALDPRLKDFRNWLYLVWKHLGLPEPTPIQYDIALYIATGPRRRGVEAFRGVGKSFITAALATHRLILDPQTKIMVVSASKERADAFSIFVKRLIQEMPELAHLKPKGDQRNSNIAFDVGPATADQSPSVKSVGITGQLTGSRANLIIADDVETPGNSQTEDQRQKLRELVKEFDAVLKPGGEILYLGTPQCEASLYNELCNRGYEFRIWPARYPDQKQLVSYGSKLAPFIVKKLEEGAEPGRTTDPRRFSDIDLAEREGSYGRSGFALQFQLDTSLSDALRYPLKLADLIVMRVNGDVGPSKVVWAGSPENTAKDLPMVGLSGDRLYYPMDIQKPWSEYTGAVMSIDPSGRGKDETGFAVVKYLGGTLYVPEAGGVDGGYEDEALTKLAKIAAKHKVKCILIESNFGDGMFAKLFSSVLQRIYPCTIEEVRSSIQKEKRIIDTLEPVMNQHRLVIDEELIREDFRGTEDPKRQLFYQMTRITKEKGALAHDDRLDALAMAVGYWVESMAQDADTARQSVEERLLDEDLARFMEQFTDGEFGTVFAPGVSKEATWINPLGAR
jgi:hypothetical protein